MSHRYAGVIAVALAILLALTRGANADTAGPTAETTRGMVVSVSRPASEVGVQVLEAGGNAVDAAVAVAFALAVTWPEAGNIGGGGFMVVFPETAAPATVFDYRETAPAAATVDTFAKGAVPEHRLVGVPGTVRGLELAHQRFGKLPWKTLVLPAVRLARDGIAVNAPLAQSLNAALTKRDRTDELRRVFGAPGGKPWQAGDRLVQPDLARTLERIATDGADAFYTGELAGLLEAEMRRGGGLITARDLAAYRAKERPPITGSYRGYSLLAPPPPSSGGICLVEMLNLVAPFELHQHERWSPRTVHLMTEAMRRAYCDRARYLGDPDFVDIPRHLATAEHARQLAASIRLDRATPSATLGADLLTAEEGQQTTHFSVIDAGGMAVANTYTLEYAFGSRIVVQGAGYLLNNEMRDFNLRPGVTDRRGTIGTPANRVAPAKRMLSSMAPVIVTRDGKAVLITGSPGGRTIINTVFSVLVNVLEYDLPLAEAVAAPRCHHAWMPDKLLVEPALIAQHPRLIQQLEALGHTVERNTTRQGDAHSIQVDLKTGRRLGVADPRRDGWAAGY